MSDISIRYNNTWLAHSLMPNAILQWNLSVTTTFISRFITCELFINVFD